MSFEQVELSGRFVEGLKNYELSKDEIEKGGWYYLGGNKEGTAHKRYWDIIMKTKMALKKKTFDHPPLSDECVCGHHIKENCYITNGKILLIVGNTCIKKFTSGRRLCEVCKEPHNNRTWNLCPGCVWNNKQLLTKFET